MQHGKELTNFQLDKRTLTDVYNTLPKRSPPKTYQDSLQDSGQ